MSQKICCFSDPPLHTTTQLANSTRYGTHRLEREWLKQIFWKGIYVFLHLLTGFYLPLLTWSWSVMAASFFNGESLCNRYKGRNRARSWRWSLSQKSDSSQKYEKTTCPFWVADTVQDKDSINFQTEDNLYPNQRRRRERERRQDFTILFFGYFLELRWNCRNIREQGKCNL